jgi:hypothetical protein
VQPKRNRFRPGNLKAGATIAGRAPVTVVATNQGDFEFDGGQDDLDSLFNGPTSDGLANLQLLTGPRLAASACVSCDGKESTVLEECAGCDAPLHHIPCGLTLRGAHFEGEPAGEAYCSKCVRNASSMGAPSQGGELYCGCGRGEGQGVVQHDLPLLMFPVLPLHMCIR